MVATHEAHLDEDATGVAGLEEAPKTTDSNESMFAFFDHVLRISQGASAHACFGVAHAQHLKAFETEGGLMARARKKRKEGERAEDDEKKVEAWRVTSFFSLPRERCWEIIPCAASVHKAVCCAFQGGTRAAGGGAKEGRGEASKQAQ